MTIKVALENVTKKWRLINSPFAAGAFNMALDESLLISAGSKAQPVTLRIFGWEPATLSLGFAQRQDEIDLTELRGLGWGMVRRPTGGRAILHVDELTYSITAPADETTLAGSLLESYHLISKAILRALSLLGVQANNEKEYPSSSSKQSAPVCFETPSNYEITTGGKKLVGSAQARKYNGLLQHGSLPLFGDLARINCVIKFLDESERITANKRLLDHATTLEAVLGNLIPYGAAQKAFTQGFAEIFQIEWVECQPTQEELSRAEDLVRTKYASDAWTFRL